MLSWLAFGLQLTVFATILYVLHKVRRIHLKGLEVEGKIADFKRSADRARGQLFAQLEALVGLYVELKIQHALAQTRGFAASPDFLRHLIDHCLAEKPAVIVECGSGVSTVVLARCAQLNGCGHVYSLEEDRNFAEQTREDLLRHGLSDWATVLLSPLRKYDLNGVTYKWYEIVTLPPGPFDLIVVDGPKASKNPLIRYPVGPLLFPQLSPTGAVFVDDAERRGEQEILKRWRKAFPAWSQTTRPCEKGCAVLRACSVSGNPSNVQTVGAADSAEGLR